MKINAQQTSIDAFYEIDNLSERRKVVYDAIKELGEACNLDVAYKIRIPINRITPRTNELVKLGLVIESKRAITPRTGKRVIFWKVAEVADINQLKEDAQKVKIVLLKKKYDDLMEMLDDIRRISNLTNGRATNDWNNLTLIASNVSAIKKLLIKE